MNIFRIIWPGAVASSDQAEFEPSQGNKRRIEAYDGLIRQAEARADAQAAPADRVAHLKLISRLEARCKREVERREDEVRHL